MKTIPVKEELFELLKKIKGDREWNDLIKSLLESNNNDIITLPDQSDINIKDLIIESIEEVKPPSKYRDMLILILFGTIGGIGLGIILPW